MGKKCMPTQRRNPKTGRCVKKSGRIGRALAGKTHKRKPAAKPKPKHRPATTKPKRKLGAKKRSGTMSDLILGTDFGVIPKKYFLTMKQARSIADGHGIAMVYAPQSYEKEILNAENFMFEDRSQDESGSVGYFHDNGDGIAVSGSGSYEWFIDIDGKLRETLQRF